MHRHCKRLYKFTNSSWNENQFHSIYDTHNPRTFQVVSINKLHRFPPFDSRSGVDWSTISQSSHAQSELAIERNRRDDRNEHAILYARETRNFHPGIFISRHFISRGENCTLYSARSETNAKQRYVQTPAQSLEDRPSLRLTEILAKE